MEYRFISEPGEPGEPKLSKGQPLKYSERLKTLKSFTKDQPLPNKVIEWLRFKSLALLAVPRKSDGDEADTYEAEVKIEEESSDHVSWQSRGRSFKCSGRRVPGGLVYLEQEGDKPYEELLYSEELKTWLSPALTRDSAGDVNMAHGVRIPSHVVDWLKKFMQREIKDPMPTLRVFRKQWARTPWCVVPSYIKAMISSRLNLPLL